MNEFTDYQPPSWDVWFMKHVYLAAEKSKDPSTKIGAIIVRDRHIISEGYNGFPVGVKDSADRLGNRELKYSYVVHGEANSVLTAARLGIPTAGASLYTQGVPCNECAKSIIQSGIKEVIVHKQWPTMVTKWVESCKISDSMFTESGVNIIWLDAVLGVKGYLDGKVVEV